MYIGAQLPIVGSALVGGMAQSYLIKKYPEWSWLLSIGMIAGGIALGTKGGILESVGVGLAAAGASGLGTALVPAGEGTSSHPLGGWPTRRSGRTGSYPAPARQPEFEGDRLV